MRPDVLAHWPTLSRLLDAALAMDTDARRMWLDTLPPEDASLRPLLERLLARHAEALLAFETLSIQTQSPAPRGESDAQDPRFCPGAEIGPFRLVRPIGRGGMGSVWLGERADGEVPLPVAIKLPSLEGHAARIAERFGRERQILASLNHPHIARLYEAGVSAEGHPYLALEYVEGTSLPAHCNDNALPVRKRLELFVQVLDAVRYAHASLVIHRDLKPSNIVVTSTGDVKLLDFGIAKLLDRETRHTTETELTQLYGKLMTMDYASPEQVLGESLGVASDIYSLGVILYELLTGVRPYRLKRGSRAELEEAILAADVIRPSQAVSTEFAAKLPSPVARWRRALRGDLDVIVLKALEKDRGGRYQSVEAFAQDCERYLQGLPVLARPQRATYRLRKFIGRHRLWLGAAAAVAIALVAGLGAALWQARVALAESQRAEQQRARAERHFASVRKLADVFMFQMHDSIKDLPGSTGARQLLVGTALEYLNTLAQEAGDDRALRRELATAYEKVADIQGQAYSANTGQQRAALDSYRKAIELLEPIVAADPTDTQARSTLARAYTEQSRLLLLHGEAERAIAASARAVAMFEALTTDAKSTRVALALALRAHAYNLEMAGKAQEGVVNIERARMLLEELLHRYPDDLDVQYGLSQVYGMSGTVLRNTRKDPATDERILDVHRKALAIDTRLVAATHGQNGTYLRALLADRANVCYELYVSRKYESAIESCRAAQSLSDTLREDRHNALATVDEAALRWNLGRALLAAGNLTEATASFERNVGVLEHLPEGGENLQVQYLLAASEQGLGGVYRELAEQHSSSRAERLKYWRLAQTWYDRAVPRFQRVTSRVTLDAVDQRAVDDAAAGLNRTRSVLASLEEH